MNNFGFTAVINSISNDSGNIAYSSCISNGKINCYAHFVDKFGEDKLFEENDSFLLLLDGIILNKEYLSKQKIGGLFAYLTARYKEKGDAFFDELRGSFCGLLMDKKRDRYVLFTDHIGSKFLYYTLQGNVLGCSTMISNLYEWRHVNNWKCSLSEPGSIMLLTYGFMLENYTICEEIKKVQPGCYVVFERGNLTEHRYCILDNTPDYTLSEQDAVELCDIEFRRAVSLQFDKDREYGYKHIVALSGGLDCRMTSWVAHEMGYKEQLNVTFSQSNYLDDVVPKQMAADMCHEWLFKALDNGLWLYNLDDIISITGGNVLYYGLAHGYSLIKYLNFDSLGLFHAGMLGDVIIGTNVKNNHEPFRLGDGAYSVKYIDSLKSIKTSDYANAEIGLFYSRFFNGTNNGQLGIMQFTETCSPHMDWDAMNAIMKIPCSMRYNHNIYKKWILSKYPEAANYTWESLKAKLTAPTFTIAGRTKSLTQWKNTFLERLHLKANDGFTVNGMNPIGYYLNTNNTLRNFIEQNLAEVNGIGNPTVRGIISSIIKEGSPIEKIQAVTLVRAVNLLKLE